MSTRIYIGGLPIKVESDNIKKKFSKYGDILSVDLKEKNDIDGNLLSKFAYVNLAAETSKVLECVSFFNGAQWKGCELKVELAKESFLDRLKRERESEKSGGIKIEAHTADYNDGYQRNNKRQREYNNYTENDSSYNGRQWKNYEQEVETVDESFQNRFKSEMEHEKSEVTNEDGAETNYCDDSMTHRNNKQKENFPNSIKNEFESDYKNVNNFIPQNHNQNEWRNRNQNSYRYGSDIPKPVQMIRYDPTKPQNAAKKRDKELNTDSKSNNADQEKKTDRANSVKQTTGKMSVFGKLDFSETAFKLDDVLSGNFSNTEEPLESSQKEITPEKPISFFYSADDARLAAAASKFVLRTSAEEFKKEYEKVREFLLSDAGLSRTNNKSKKSRNKKSR